MRNIFVGCILLFASSCFGQGVIQFMNDATTPVQYTMLGETSPRTVPPSNGFVALLWTPANTRVAYKWSSRPSNLTDWLALNPGWIIVNSSSGEPLRVPISGTQAGVFDGGAMTIPTDQPIDAMVVGWTGSATSFDQAYRSMMSWGPALGMSEPFRIDPAPLGSATPPRIVEAGFAGMTLIVPIPEPSMTAFAALGALALLLVARRPGK